MGLFCISGSFLRNCSEKCPCVVFAASWYIGNTLGLSSPNNCNSRILLLLYLKEKSIAENGTCGKGNRTARHPRPVCLPPWASGTGYVQGLDVHRAGNSSPAGIASFLLPQSRAEKRNFLKNIYFSTVSPFLQFLEVELAAQKQYKDHSRLTWHFWVWFLLTEE